MLKPDLIELDQLEHVCKYPKSKKLLGEAIGCYRAGSYRSAISTTWLAAVIDFISKLEELAEKDHADARILVNSFYGWQENREAELSNLLLFEKEILEKAKNDFQFINQLEYDDLKRLYVDRNKCSHPSMKGTELYNPPAELARYYLRMVVESLLMHKATLGRAALKEIWTAIQSFTFPTNAEDAESVLRSGPLGHGVRDSVKKELAEGLMSSILKEEHGESELNRRIAALRALQNIDNECVENAFSLKLNQKISSLSDGDRLKVLPLLKALPNAMHSISPLEKSKISQSFELVEVATHVEIVIFAMYIDELRISARGKLLELPVRTIANIISQNSDLNFLELSIEALRTSSNFENSTAVLYTLVLPYSELFIDSQICQIVRLFSENNQIYWAEYNVPQHILTFLERTANKFTVASAEWNNLKEAVLRQHHDHVEWQKLILRIIELQSPSS